MIVQKKSISILEDHGDSVEAQCTLYRLSDNVFILSDLRLSAYQEVIGRSTTTNPDQLKHLTTQLLLDKYQYEWGNTHKQWKIIRKKKTYL